MVEKMTFNPRPDYCNILLQYVFFEKRHSSVCISNVFVKLQFLQIFTIFVTLYVHKMNFLFNSQKLMYTKKIFFSWLAKLRSIQWTSRKFKNSKIPQTSKYRVQEHFWSKGCEFGFANLHGILEWLFSFFQERELLGKAIYLWMFNLKIKSLSVYINYLSL